MDGGMNHHPSMENAVWSMGGFRDLRLHKPARVTHQNKVPAFITNWNRVLGHFQMGRSQCASFSFYLLLIFGR